MSKKAGQNQGSVIVRKDGLVMAQITVNGKRVTKYFKTKREANAWRVDTLQKIRRGLFYSGPQVSVAEYLAEWLTAKKGAVKPKTHAQYQRIIEKHINPVLGQIKLDELRPEKIQAFYNEKLDRGTGVRTVRLIHAVLHGALNHALKLGLVYRNPSDAVYKPKAPKKEMRVLDEKQARSLLIAARGKRFEVLYKIAITTGLRQGEILGLKWSDLDWETGQLKIQRQVQRVPHKGLVFSEPKTAAGRRLVVLGRDTLKALKQHKERQWEEIQFMGERWQENDLIFPSSTGTAMDPHNLIHRFKQVLQEANLPDIRFHDLRHTAATLMLKQGVPVKVVQERLGHSDAAMTLNVYSHTIPGMQEEAARKMDEITALIEINELIDNEEN